MPELRLRDRFGASHAAHLAWESYPLFDERLHRNRDNADGERLADEASAFLGLEARVDHEVFAITESLNLLSMTVADVALVEVMQRLGTTRAWSLNEGYALLGLVCEESLIEVEATEIAAIEMHRLKRGYLALIDLEMVFVLLTLAVQRVYDMKLGWGRMTPSTQAAQGKP
jgi:hypothetical protein